MMRAFTVCVILVLAVVSAYGEARNNGFVDFDDPMYVVDCYHVRQGITFDGTRWAFTTFDAANWHPLTWLSHMLDVQVFGVNPGMHHMVNVGCHALNALLVLACFLALTGAFWPSAVAAMVWAVHPLRVESVAWISERKDVLSAMFGLVCILAHVWYARRPSLARGLVEWLALALSLMCKPMLVTWPFLLLVLDIWPLQRWRRTGGSGQDATSPRSSMPRLIAEKLPLLALSLVSCMLTLQAQRAGSAVLDTTQVGIWSRIANAIVAYAGYVGDLFWPHDLAALYPHPVYLPMTSVVLSATMLAAVTVGAIALRRRMPWLLVGWLWFLGTLVPVIGLVQVGAQAMADRYTYIPHLGLMLAMALTLDRIVDRRALPVALVGVACAVPLWMQTRIQVRVWRTPESLYTHALAVTSDNWLIHNNMGVLAMDRNALDEAEEHYRQAMRIRPADSKVLTNLSECMVRRGHFADAIRCLTQAHESAPDDLSVINNLAWLLATAPNPVLRDPARALALAQRLQDECPRTAPGYPLYMDTVGVCYAANGRFDEAVAIGRAALAAIDVRAAPHLARQIERNIDRYEHRQAIE